MQELLDVFGENIELEIDESARLEEPQVRLFPGVRNDPDDETLSRPLRDRQADAVDCDRTFGRDVAREVVRQIDLEAEIRALLLKTENARGAVDVALDEVSAEAAIRGKCALEINKAAIERAEIRPRECFFEQIENNFVCTEHCDR